MSLPEKVAKLILVLFFDWQQLLGFYLVYALLFVKRNRIFNTLSTHVFNTPCKRRTQHLAILPYYNNLSHRQIFNYFPVYYFNKLLVWIFKCKRHKQHFLIIIGTTERKTFDVIITRLIILLEMEIVSALINAYKNLKENRQNRNNVVNLLCLGTV